MAFSTDNILGIWFIVAGGWSVVHSHVPTVFVDPFLSTSLLCAGGILLYALVCL